METFLFPWSYCNIRFFGICYEIVNFTGMFL